MSSKAPKANGVITPIDRSSAGLREFLFGILDRITAGDISPQEAQAAAKACAQINTSVMVEIEYHKHVARGPLLQGGEVPSTVLHLGHRTNT